MPSGSRKQIDVTRLKADVTAAGIEILSAHCAADRVRLNYSPGRRRGLRRAPYFEKRYHLFPRPLSFLFPDRVSFAAAGMTTPGHLPHYPTSRPG